MGSLSVNRSLHSVCGERKGLRLPILPVRIYTPSGYNVVYTLIDTGSEECLISKKLYRELNLYGVPLQVLLITADRTRSLVLNYDRSFDIGPIEMKDTKHKISQALVLDKLPSIDQNFPTSNNLRSIKNTTDLIENKKILKLPDSELHLIICDREVNLINFEKIRKPLKQNKPFVAKCKIG